MEGGVNLINVGMSLLLIDKRFDYKLTKHKGFESRIRLNFSG